MMRRNSFLLALLISIVVAPPAGANIIVELSFSAKMDASDVVVVGTVMAATPGNPGQYNATATVMVLATLKGAPQAQHIVFTQSSFPERSPQCCEVGATYVMFLRHVPDRPELASVNGRHGMIRIGPANNEPRIEVIPDPELR